MLHLSLQHQILAFVKEFFLVEERQVRKFFNDWGPNNVDYEITRMIAEKYLYRIGTRLSTVSTLPTSQHNYESKIRAIDVLCYFPSHDVRDINRENWPLELSFVTNDNIIYDIAVFSSIDVAGKLAHIKRNRSRYLPDGFTDPTNHVAVVESQEMALMLDKHCDFSVYAIVDRNGAVELYT